MLADDTNDQPFFVEYNIWRRRCSAMISSAAVTDLSWERLMTGWLMACATVISCGLGWSCRRGMSRFGDDAELHALVGDNEIIHPLFKHAGNCLFESCRRWQAWHFSIHDLFQRP